MYLKRIITLLGLAAALAALSGCGRSTPPTSGTQESEGPAPAPDFPGMEADLASTVAAQTGFYAFATPADFAQATAGLKWEDGSDTPEFANPEAPKGGTIRIWLQDYPRTLRTIGPDATGGIRQYLLDDVAMRMLFPHPNLPGRHVPGIARRWAVSRETRTVFFEIDPDARWSDGKPITTDDIVFHFYFNRSPHLGEPWYNDFYTKTYERLTVYGPLQFAMTMPEAKPDMVDRSSNWAPYPRHEFQDFGPDWLKKYDWRIIATSSPYLIDPAQFERQRGQAVTLVRNKDWWARDRRFYRGRFNPDEVRLTVIRDPDKAFETFLRGDLDLFGLGSPILWYTKLPADSELVSKGYIHRHKFYNQTPRPDWGLWINRSKPLLDNQDVRQGIQFATNFELVCTQFFRGDAVVMDTRSDGYSWRMHPTITHRPFDPARARTLFAKAGFTNQGPDGVLTNSSGERLSFRLLAYVRPGTQEILSILKSEALKAGLEFQIVIQDGTTAWKTVQEKNHEIAFIALNRSVELYPRYWEMYHGSNAWQDAYLGPDGSPVNRFADGTPNPKPAKVRVQTNNMTMTFIPELDRLIETYDRSESLDEMKALAARMEQIIHDDAAWVNGYAVPFMRGGSWRWVRWPEGFNAMQARDIVELWLFAIDTAAKEETEAQRRSGKAFPPVDATYEQFRRQ